LFFYAGVNKGLKEYHNFIDTRDVGGFQELREVTQKPKINENFYSMGDSKGNFKQATNKNIVGLVAPISHVPPPKEINKENYEEEAGAMIDEDEEKKK
jgi:hypothetical protein